MPYPGEPYFLGSRYPEDLTPGGRLVNLNRAIHTGDIFGIPSQSIPSLVSLLAVVQVVSGVVMWLEGA